MYRSRRKLLSQNFLYNRKLVKKLVDQTSIGNSDHVIDIGSGKGILSQELITKACFVTAIEIDTYWFQYLKTRLISPKFKIYNQNFLHFSLPKGLYKVFANLPFSIESQIVGKLLQTPNPPIDAYLIVDNQYAQQILKPHTLFFSTYAPWFEIKHFYNFKSSDFHPLPNIKPTMIHIHSKSQSRISPQLKDQYLQFIRQGFGQGHFVFRNLLKHYSLQTTSTAFQHLSLSKKLKPNHFQLNHWIQLFNQFHLKQTH